MAVRFGTGNHQIGRNSSPGWGAAAGDKPRYCGPEVEPLSAVTTELHEPDSRGLDPAIHAGDFRRFETRMPGTRPILELTFFSLVIVWEATQLSFSNWLGGFDDLARS